MTAPYQLFAALPAHIEDALRASIERFGVLVPIAKDQHGNVLDGHHRERIARELGVAPRYDRIVVRDEAEAAEIAHTLNAERRQLTGDELRQAVVHLAEWRDRHGVGLSNVQIADALHVAEGTVRNELDRATSQGYEVDRPDRVRGKDGKDRPSRRPTVVASKNVKEDERAGAALAVLGDDTPDVPVLDVKRAERVAREVEAERRRLEPAAPVTVVDEVEIRHGDFREALDDLKPGSVDAIVTDPPYPQQYWHLYEDLGALARRVLKPNGVLAVMTGTRLEMLDNVDLLISRSMRPRCRCIYLTPGQRWRDQNERVAVGYKPILIYAHPDATDLPWINDDVFTSTGTHEQDQRFHHWGQSEGGFAQIIERLTMPGALVVDPFLGGGTTAVVCRDLGRRFVGCDIDAAHVATARGRVA